VWRHHRTPLCQVRPRGANSDKFFGFWSQTDAANLLGVPAQAHKDIEGQKAKMTDRQDTLFPDAPPGMVRNRPTVGQRYTETAADAARLAGHAANLLARLRLGPVDNIEIRNDIASYGTLGIHRMYEVRQFLLAEGRTVLRTRDKDVPGKHWYRIVTIAEAERIEAARRATSRSRKGEGHEARMDRALRDSD